MAMNTVDKWLELFAQELSAGEARKLFRNITRSMTVVLPPGCSAVTAKAFTAQSIVVARVHSHHSLEQWLRKHRPQWVESYEQADAIRRLRST